MSPACWANNYMLDIMRGVRDLRTADSDIVSGWVRSVGAALQRPNVLFLGTSLALWGLSRTCDKRPRL